MIRTSLRMFLIQGCFVCLAHAQENFPQENATPRATPAPKETPSNVPDLERRLFEIEERLDQVEKKTLLDRVQISGDYRTIYNGVMYNGPSPLPFQNPPGSPIGRHIEQSSPEIWSHRLRLRMVAEPHESVRITARLVMYKIFGNSNAPPFIQDSNQTRIPRDAAARFDQVWIDWFMTEWVALSGGRIAYTEGNPAELRENSTVRRATWGLHMVDGEYETLNLTFNLTKIIPDWYIRAFYASWFNPNTGEPFGGSLFLNTGVDNLRILGGNMDISIPGLGKNFIQVGYYIVPRFRPFSVPIPDPGYDPAADYTHAPIPLNGSQLFPSVMPHSLGAYHNLSALVEFYNIGGSGLDVFASGAVGKLIPNGQGIAYDLPSNPADPTSPRAPFPFLFLASQGDKGYTAFAYAGLRYALPIKALNKPKIGFEVNYGSRYHISFAVQTDQLLTKLATRGSAYETYVIFPINDALFIRGTYLFIDGNYNSGFFGPNPAVFGSTAPRADYRVHSFNAALNANF